MGTKIGFGSKDRSKEGYLEKLFRMQAAALVSTLKIKILSLGVGAVGL